jgi:hypothetical protein
MTKQPLNDDDRLLNLARDLVKERGIGLMEAMEIAEERLQPKPTFQTEYTITLKLKPRIARWVEEVFGGHDTYTIEERMAAFLAPYLAQARIGLIRDEAEKGRKIVEGEAVTVRRHRLEDAK